MKRRVNRSLLQVFFFLMFSIKLFHLWMYCLYIFMRIIFVKCLCAAICTKTFVETLMANHLMVIYISVWSLSGALKHFHA